MQIFKGKKRRRNQGVCRSPKEYLVQFCGERGEEGGQCQHETPDHRCKPCTSSTTRANDQGCRSTRDGSAQSAHPRWNVNSVVSLSQTRQYYTRSTRFLPSEISRVENTYLLRHGLEFFFQFRKVTLRIEEILQVKFVISRYALNFLYFIYNGRWL